ncbi:hypothetical protein GCM10022205_17280 [Spinactinospora alkalitolerans]
MISHTARMRDQRKPNASAWRAPKANPTDQRDPLRRFRGSVKLMVWLFFLVSGVSWWGGRRR